jgi:DNA-cytosine methyltransferase
MKVLSLFDGMSCGQIALDQLGIKVDTYYASEIDKYGIEITQKNYPNTVQVGDITKLDPKDFQDVDLIMGGSPCQGFSFAGKQLAFDDPRSALFFEFIRMLKAIKPKYFLLENVRMKKEFLDIISQQVSECYPEITFGIQPILINSSLVSAQSRQRYYWTNIPNIEQPEERGIVLKDILENDFSSEKDKSYCIDANYFKGASVEQYKKKSRRQLVSKPKKAFDIPRDILKDNEMRRRVYSSEGKSPTLNTMGGGNREPKVVTGGAFRGRAYDKDGKRMDRDGSSVANKTKQMLELRKDDKSNAITTVGKDSVVVDEELTWRKLTPLECERLQTVPDNYTEGVSNTQRYKMLGNGWTVEVIKHILGYME